MTQQTAVPPPLSRLAESWRAEARELRDRYADERTARVCEAHAGELLQATREAMAEEVSLADAIAISGYSESGLRKLANQGRLKNIGRKGSPRFLRSALPQKAVSARRAIHQAGVPDRKRRNAFDPQRAAARALNQGG